MPKITTEGRHTVKIETATFKEAPRKDDPDAFKVSLKGVTPDGHEAWGEMEFSNFVIPSGKYKDMSVYDISVQTLKDIGVEDGYLGNLNSAIEAGIECDFVMQWDSWIDKTSGEQKTALKVKYINAIPKTINVKDVNWSEKIAKLTGQSNNSQTTVKQNEPVEAEPVPSDFDAVPEQAVNTKDDLPF